MNNVVNQVAYLRTSREFPEEIRQLALENNKAYIDTANAVNARIIGIFPVTRPAITGESWFLRGNQRQQTLRQVYTFSSTASINHGVTVITPGQFINCYVSYTDGANTYGLPFTTSVAIAGQITFYTTPTQIVFSVGAGAPALTSGTIVLQWLSSP
jgi:hypothetical protein